MTPEPSNFKPLPGAGGNQGAPKTLVCPAGTVPYDSAWEWQKTLRERRAAGELPDLLLLLDHPPTYTLGRSTRPDHLKAAAARGVSIHRIERGGSITYHGPGQIVGYPIVDLRPRGRDIHRFIRELEEVLIRTLSELGVCARRRPGRDAGCGPARGLIAPSRCPGERRCVRALQRGRALPRLRHPVGDRSRGPGSHG